MLQSSISRWHFIAAFLILGALAASFGLVIYSLVDDDTYEVVLPPTPERADKILDYWLGGSEGKFAVSPARVQLWKSPNEKQEDEMKTYFSHDIKLVDTDYGHWKLHSRGRLALILLTDVFAQASMSEKDYFEMNEMAAEIAMEGIRKNQDKDLNLVERGFFYRPFVYTESLAMQNRAVGLYEALLESAPSQYRDLFEFWYAQAKHNRDIIHKYGRFPERNALLKRDSTTQEEIYLEELLRQEDESEGE